MRSGAEKELTRRRLRKDKKHVERGAQGLRPKKGLKSQTATPSGRKKGLRSQKENRRGKKPPFAKGEPVSSESEENSRERSMKKKKWETEPGKEGEKIP